MGEFNVHYEFEIWRFVSRIFVVVVDKIDVDFWGPLCESDDFVLLTPPRPLHRHLRVLWFLEPISICFNPQCIICMFHIAVEMK